LRLGALSSLLKAIGLAWQLDPILLGLAAKVGPKNFQKEPPTLGPAA